MSTSEGWVRIIDAMDLMEKSGWNSTDAKNALAIQIARGTIRWRADWARYWNPISEQVEEMSDERNPKLKQSPVEALFSYLLKNPNADRSKHKENSVNIYVADWKLGVFRALAEPLTSGPFFAIHGLYVERVGLMRLLTAQTILNDAAILEFDGWALGSFWADTTRDSSNPTPRSDDERDKRIKRVAIPKLRAWWENLGQEREPQSIPALWSMAKAAFPENAVPRAEIEKLAGGRKPGRKPIPRE